jgi:hypothetical protein
MAMTDTKAARGGPATRRGEGREYILLLAVTYPFFLAATLVGRLRPAEHRPFSGAATQRPGIFREAWQAARSSLPFAFMG